MPTIALDRISEHHFISSWLDASNDKGKLLIVDLGMNAGEFAREMLRRYHHSRVVAVEANPRLASAVEQRPTLHCYNYAIGPENGPVSFGIDPDDSTVSSLNETGGSQTNIVVEGIHFADFVEKTHLENEVIDLLKIDIEGSELELFEQTPACFFTNVRQIAVEFHAFSNPDHLPRITKILARMRALDFHCVDFTTNFQDVLMVNKRPGLNQFRRIQMMEITLSKYVRGVKRKLARIGSRMTRLLKPIFLPIEIGAMTPALISIWRFNYYEPESETPYLRKTVLGTAARDAEIARFTQRDGGDELRISALLGRRSCPDPFP